MWGSALWRPLARVLLKACLDCKGLPEQIMLPTSATRVLPSLTCLGLQASRSLQRLHLMSLAAAARSTSWQLQHLRAKAKARTVAPLVPLLVAAMGWEVAGEDRACFRAFTLSAWLTAAALPGSVLCQIIALLKCT